MLLFRKLPMKYYGALVPYNDGIQPAADLFLELRSVNRSAGMICYEAEFTMTKDQINEYSKLGTLRERAQFLLKIGVSARINIVDLTPVMQACVGETLLPVTGDNEQDAIEKGIAWLKEKAV